MKLKYLDVYKRQAYAVANPGVTDVKITQQTGTCTGIVKDATGEGVIVPFVVPFTTTDGTITGLDGDFSLSLSLIHILLYLHQTFEKFDNVNHLSYVKYHIYSILYYLARLSD